MSSFEESKDFIYNIGDKEYHC